MKYTNYILHGNFIHLEQFISPKPIAKQFTILFLILVAFLGIFALLCMIPLTLTGDVFRLLKMQYHIYMQKYKMYKYYDEALGSLNLVYKENLMVLLNKGKPILMNPNIEMKNIISTVPFKIKLQYMLTSQSYLIVDKRISMVDKLNKGFIYLKETINLKLAA